MGVKSVSKFIVQLTVFNHFNHNHHFSVKVACTVDNDDH